MAALEKELVAAQKRIATLEASDWEKQIASLRKQLTEARRSLPGITRAANGTVFMSNADRRNVRACLHPDNVQDAATRKRYERASQWFNALPIPEIKEAP